MHGIVLLLAVVGASAPEGQILSFAAGDLRLTVDENLRVSGIAVGSTRLSVQPLPLVTLSDPAQKKTSAPTVIGRDPSTGFALRFPESQAGAALTIRPQGDALRFTCRLKGDDLPARGMLLRFALPFDATGWRWHADMARSAPIEAGRTYENVAALRAWADLPEWKGQPDLRVGYSNRNFLTVVTGPAGLCLAVPLDRPCIFRTAYNAAAKRLELVYDLALAPETRTPNEVELVFDLYACDPRWGFRDALARYYQLYPKLFARLVNRPGQWMAFSRLSEIDNANEFYFGLQEGAPEAAYDDQLGVLTTTYFTHAGMGANLPGYNPEKDSLPPYENQVQAMEAAFKARTGVDGLYAQVGLHNAEGRLDVRKWVAYGHLIAQFNLDPQLPYGDWTLKQALKALQQFQESKRGDLDGFYYDGLSTGTNYNPRHFRTAQAPCLWDPVAKKPLLNNFFSSCQFARAAAETLRPRGKITMMNGALGASFYVAPWLDVLGSETGLEIPREQLNYIRSITWHKPFLTLLKGNYEQQLGHAEIERYMKQCLAYGVVPGFFDWPTSGLGPGSGYWLHPCYYERDRSLFRTYLPLCCTLARVGWEPVPYATCSEAKTIVERFGPADDGITWLTVCNEDAQAHSTTLRIDPQGLRIDPATTRAVDALADKPLALTTENGELRGEIELPAKDVAVIQLGSPAALARWRIQEASETLNRGVVMRRLDAGKPPLAVHWRPMGRTYTRQQREGQPQLAFTGDPRSPQRAQQWVMLFQSQPAELTLRVLASAEDLKGPARRAGIDCRLAWVTPSFSYYKQEFFELPTGTYEQRQFEFPIRSPQALRAIQLTAGITNGVQGTLRIGRISLVDPQGKEYIIDPQFQEWYEPLPPSLRQPVEQCGDAIRTDLVDLQSLVTRSDQPLQQTTERLLGRCNQLRATISREHAENGCRRVLRDLETIERLVKGLAP
jgi:hypothetical protein